DTFGLAFYKAELAAGFRLPLEGTVLITVAPRDRKAVLPAAKRFANLGFRILATAGTRAFLAENGVPCEPVKKLYEGRPNILDALHNGEIQLVVNTPAGKEAVTDDSYIRKAAVKYKIPYITTPAAAFAAAEGIRAAREETEVVKSLQEYHQGITTQ
ncbi:MAG: carbamoyl phosphate synthase large subunit, partial [Armatimonadota bacterium]|nr:carbamoyl phosphate synthase large subunit [Armatimonadota bacterium]